jgi:rhamnogalacturonyl hydrolase YesR
MMRANAPTVPNTTLSWASEATFQVICFDANLTLHHPTARERLGARADKELFDSLADRVLKSQNVLWYDATRYQWEGMVDGYEITGEERFLTTARDQMLSSIDNVPNDLRNCDTVAPIIPMMRLYQITKEQRLLDYAIDKFDRYIEITPKYRGGWVNFPAYPNHVRTEILFQVLPGLLALGRISGNKKYLEIGMDQYVRLRELMFDQENGLWSHGCGAGGRSYGFWTRGAAFSLMGDLQVLEQLRPGDSQYALCRDTFLKNAASVAKYQDASGFWFCVIDAPTSQWESSGTAWNAATFHRALRLGYLGEEYRRVADRAWQAAKSRIWQGDFPGHMTATTISKDRAYYLKKPLNDTGWSHFAFRAACENLRK